MAKVKLGDVARECRATWKGDRTNVPIVGLEHLIPQEIRFTDHSTDSEGTFNKKFTAGQVLFGRRRAYQQKAAVAEFDGICSGDITVLEVIPGKMLPELLPYIIQNPRFFDFAVQGSAGSLSPRVKWEHICNYEFELQGIAEQRALSEKLWAAYRLKEAYKRLLTATDEMVKAQFIEMFGDKPRTGQLRDWVNLNIDKVKKLYSPEDEIEYIDISSVNGSTNSVESTTTYKLQDAPSRAQQCIKLGDILLSTVRPNLKNIAINQIDKPNLVASTGFCVLRPKSGYSQIILSTITSDAFTQAMIDVAKGSNYPAFHDYDALNYPIYNPSDEELSLATKIQEQAEKSKGELRKAIEAIDGVIKSLING